MPFLSLYVKKTFTPYSIYRLTSNENRYVVPLAYAPVWNDRDGWKTRSYEWFRTYMKHPGVHVVFDDDPPPAKAPAVQGVRYRNGNDATPACRLRNGLL